MDARLLFLCSTLFIFGEGTTTGADPDSNVRIFLRMNGESQGSIVGDATLPMSGGDPATEVVEVRDRVFVPTDPQTGLPSGTRRYEGVVIRKPLDRSTPLLASALASNENITEAELRVYTVSQIGEVDHRFTYVLSDARIVSIERELFGRSSTSSAMVPRPEEEFTLRFRTIEIIDEVSGTSFFDSIGGGADVPITGKVSESDDLVTGPAEESVSTSEQESTVGVD